MNVYFYFRVICIANQETAWVGGDSGNIRVVTLNTEPKLAELHVQTTVVPGLAPVGRITSSNQWRRPTAIMTRPNVNAIDSVPEEQELQSGGSDAGTDAVPLILAGHHILVKHAIHLWIHH